jgi:hypothetical protein
MPPLAAPQFGKLSNWLTLHCSLRFHHLHSRPPVIGHLHKHDMQSTAALWGPHDASLSPQATLLLLRPPAKACLTPPKSSLAPSGPTCCWPKTPQTGC